MRCTQLSSTIHQQLYKSTLASSRTTGSNSSINEYDICIVGAGMVGSTLAVSLATNPITSALRIALIDSNKIQSSSDKLSEIPNIRVSSITTYNAAQYKSMGVWNLLKRINEFNRMYVNECYNNQSHIEWLAEQCNTDVLGYIVENNILTDALYDRIYSMKSNNSCNIDLYDNITINKIGHSYKSIIPNTYPVIRYNNDELLSCKLLVGADGPNSLVKQFAQISSVGYHYNQHAVVATVKLAKSHHTAYQRFLPNGPVALLPCHDNYSNVVWSTTPQHAKYLTSCTEQQFINDLNSVYNIPSGNQWRSGGQSQLFDIIPNQLSELFPILFAKPSNHIPPSVTTVCDKRVSFPLQFVHSLNYIHQRIALIGDSAHVIHPLAGQGVNLGISDALTLSNIISTGVSNGQDIGDELLLQQYQSIQQRSNLLMMTGIDTIGRIFRWNDGGLPTLRNIGITVLNSIPAIKNRIAGIAMGLNTTQPIQQQQKQSVL